MKYTAHSSRHDEIEFMAAEERGETGFNAPVRMKEEVELMERKAEKTKKREIKRATKRDREERSEKRLE